MHEWWACTCILFYFFLSYYFTHLKRCTFQVEMESTDNGAASLGYQPAARRGQPFVKYKGCLYMVGGWRSYNEPIDASVVEIFDPNRLMWKHCNTTGVNPGEVFSTAYVTVDGNLYIFGGQSNNQRIDAMWQLNLESLQWSSVSQRNPPSPRSCIGMVAEGRRRLVLYGGHDASNRDFNDLHTFSIQDGNCTIVNLVFDIYFRIRMSPTYFIVHTKHTACILCHIISIPCIAARILGMTVSVSNFVQVFNTSTCYIHAFCE